MSGAPEGGRGLVGAGKRASWEESVGWEKTGLQSLKRVFFVVFFFFNIFPHGNREPLKAVQQSRS